MSYRKQRRPGGDLGRAIRCIRRRLNFSQSQLGARLDWAQNTVTQYELGVALPRAGRLVDLLRLAANKEEAAPIIAALEAQGICPADLFGIVSNLPLNSMEQSSEVNQ